ncbi:hypothetical protein [Streptomyces rubradiris]|uniref:Uncharacterized protein n=1 Tax=Streptomyces rubradiris TaxID=285531 RepID=A0ABQ3RAD9_STRRR|nr:hypothetical protein [Streptomyces rubradiris]GHH26117.1 hypothetical protein GCM10018792_66200 [Streptomyces rubradiris]GHI52825.1 hypothetical protein Srubr_26710 [Streptomyces rubradiris]
MTTNTDTASGTDWLDRAEAEYAAEEAAFEADSARLAASMADGINAYLARMGITPFTPAVADGENVVPALVAPEDPERKLYGVHVTLDDEEGYVLLVSDYRGDVDFALRPASVRLDGPRSVVLARRYGPAPEKPKPTPKPQPSADAQAIVRAIERLVITLESAVLSAAHAGGRR